MKPTFKPLAWLCCAVFTVSVIATTTNIELNDTYAIDKKKIQVPSKG